MAAAHSTPRLLYLATLLAVLAASAGCLQRRITITSDPPNAVVWLNDQEVGRTPVTTSFTFFGTYDIRLHLDGYEPLITSRDTGQPWYEYPPFDLLAEAIPLRIRTEVRWHFDLAPTPERSLPRPVMEQELLERARRVRGEHIGDERPATPPPSPDPS